MSAPHEADEAAPADSAAGDESRLSLLEAENADLRRRLGELDGDASDLAILDDERILQNVGIYRYHHPLENADAYKARLSDLSSQIVALVKERKAIEKSNMFT